MRRRSSNIAEQLARCGAKKGRRTSEFKASPVYTESQTSKRCTGKPSLKTKTKTKTKQQLQKATTHVPPDQNHFLNCKPFCRGTRK